jgi:hypothetical protein
VRRIKKKKKNRIIGEKENKNKNEWYEYGQKYKEHDEL